MGNSVSVTVPEKMMAATINEASGPIELSEVAVPRPRSGQVLVKVDSSPINPSDVAHTHGKYAHTAKFPAMLGFEGSGVVVRSGGGVMANYMLGKRVSFYAVHSGAWAEYVVVDAMSTVSLPENISLEEGSMGFVNPMTIMMFLDIALKLRARTVILTAGASAVSRMFARVLNEQGIPVVLIVRRKEQEDLLRNENPKYFILNQTSENFAEDLKQIAQIQGAKLCFDAVGGELTVQIVNALPAKSTIFIYGSLSGKKVELEVGPLLFNAQSVRGFHAKHYLSTLGKLDMLRLFLRYRKYRSLGLFKTQVSRKFGLDEIKEALTYYKKNMTEGKVLILPASRAGAAAQTS